MISSIDVLTPFDVTEYTQLTAAQLEQLVSGVTPYTDKGFIMVSVDVAGVASVPNATNTPKWQNYIWIRVQATTVTPYVWNPNGATDFTLLNWVTISSVAILPGSITGSQIAPNTITSTNIASVSSAVITGSVPNSWLAQLNNIQTGYVTNGLMNNTSSVFGDLSGAGSTVAIPIIGLGIVTGQNGLNQSQIGVSGKTALGTFTGANIANSSLTTLQLLNNGGSVTTSLTNSAVDPLANIMVPTKSVIGIPANGSSTQNVAAGDVLAVGYNATSSETGYVTVARAILKLADPTTETYPQVPIVNANQTTYSLVNPQGSNSSNPFGRVLQFIQGLTTTKVASSGNLANATSAPNANATGMTALTSVTITPLNTGSTIRLQFSGTIYISAQNPVFVGVYTGTGAVAPLGGCAVSYPGPASCMANFDLFLTGQGTTSITYFIRFGIATANSAVFNQIDGSGDNFGGGLQAATITVTELL